MEKANLDTLKRVRDKLSFVIFTLSVKSKHNIEFSQDEARGYRDILSQISQELHKIIHTYGGTATFDKQVQEHISTMAKEFSEESTE